MRKIPACPPLKDREDLLPASVSDSDCYYTPEHGFIHPRQLVVHLPEPFDRFVPNHCITDGYQHSDQVSDQEFLKIITRNLQQQTNHRADQKIADALSNVTVSPKKCFGQMHVMIDSANDLGQLLADLGSPPSLPSGSGGGSGGGDEGVGYSMNTFFYSAIGKGKYLKRDLDTLPPDRTLDGLFGDHNVKVAVVDSGPFSDLGVLEDGDEICHSDIIHRIIRSVTNKKVIIDDHSLKPKCGEPVMLFDLICKLMELKGKGYDVINISMGFHGQAPTIALRRALGDLSALIFCSAGNVGFNNDEHYHWPSNFSAYVPNVYGIGATDAVGNYEDYSNFGKATVDFSAQGSWLAKEHFRKHIIGTSFSTALVSGLVAGALTHVSSGDRAGKDFREVVQLISTNFGILNLGTHPTKTQLCMLSTLIDK